MFSIKSDPFMSFENGGIEHKNYLLTSTKIDTLGAAESSWGEANAMLPREMQWDIKRGRIMKPRRTQMACMSGEDERVR